MQHRGAASAAGLPRRSQELTAEHGVVLVFDEVITGFRVGLQGAQGLLGVTPDLAVFAKALAAGSRSPQWWAGAR